MSDAVIIAGIFAPIAVGMGVWIKSISAALDRANLRNDKAEDRHREDIAVVRAEGKVTADAFNVQQGENKMLEKRVLELAQGKETDKAAFAVSSAAYEREIAELKKANVGLQDTITKYETKIAELEKRVGVLEGQKAALVQTVKNEPAEVGLADALVNAGENQEAAPA